MRICLIGYGYWGKNLARVFGKDLVGICDYDQNNLETHNKLRALIFPAFQHPIVDGKEVKRSLYKNGKFVCEYV